MVTTAKRKALDSISDFQQLFMILDVDIDQVYKLCWVLILADAAHLFLFLFNLMLELLVHL